MDPVAAYRAGLIETVRDTGTQFALAAADPDWSDAAWKALRDLAASRLEFSSDDLLDEIGVPDSPGAIGALFRTAARSGLIHCVGYTTSTRLARHGGLQRVWRGGGSS